MKKNQINIFPAFFAHINNMGNPPRVWVIGRKNNKTIKFNWMYGSRYPYKMSLEFFVQKLKDKYDIPEELKTEKEVIDYCQELFYDLNEQKHT